MSAPLTAEELLASLPDLSVPPPIGQKRFRVTVLEWLSHVIVLDAVDAKAAEEIAAAFWFEGCGDAFRVRCQGTDGFQVDEIERGVR